MGNNGSPTTVGREPTISGLSFYERKGEFSIIGYVVVGVSENPYAVVTKDTGLKKERRVEADAGGLEQSWCYIDHEVCTTGYSGNFINRDEGKVAVSPDFVIDGDAMAHVASGDDPTASEERVVR